VLAAQVALGVLEVRLAIVGMESRPPTPGPSRRRLESRRGGGRGPARGRGSGASRPEAPR
jgi:hypothetical protein